MRELRLREALRLQLGNAVTNMPIRWITLPQVDGYRRRIRMRIFDDARIGFFNPRKYSDCVVLTAALRTKLSALIGGAAKYAQVIETLHHFELREPDADGVAAAYFVKRETHGSLCAEALEQLDDWLTGMYWAVAGEPKPIPCQTLPLPGSWQWVPISSFLQVNQTINALLVQDLVDAARRHGHATFCDLYSGSGNFMLPLLARGLSGLGVELDASAAKAAQRAAEAQNFEGVVMQLGEAGATIESMAVSRQSFDLVIIDPPRTGISRGLSALPSIVRKHLAYCSCNTTSLARDLGALARLGFVVETITLYDMFKYTDHVECLVWLRAPHHY